MAAEYQTAALAQAISIKPAILEPVRDKTPSTNPAKKKPKKLRPNPQRWPWPFEQWISKLSSLHKKRAMGKARACVPADQVRDTVGILLAAAHRNHDCEHYSNCLGLAAIDRWPGFSCRKCPLTGDLPPSPTDP